MKRRIFWLFCLALAVGLCACAPGPATDTHATEGTEAAPVKTVKLRFSPNNGDPDFTVDAPQGQLFSDPPVPKKRCCDFAGWYYNEKLWDPAVEKVEKSISLTAKWTLAANAFEKDPNAAVRAEGTDLRVCSFNILSPTRGAKHPIGDRDLGVLHFAQAYQPDIIALQEYDSPWHPDFLEVFQGTAYRLISEDSYTFDGIGSSRQLAYRTDRLTLVESGLADCIVDSYNGRFVWALFETKDSAKHRFIATSVHWHWNSAETREGEAKVFSGWILEAQKKYGVPIVCLGDYNANESEVSYLQMLKTAQLQDAKYTAQKRGLVASTYHAKPSADSYPEDKVNTVLTIDHIFSSKDMQALYYDTVLNAEILTASDHLPIYADFRFKSAT